jgi:hypothetical protein
MDLIGVAAVIAALSGLVVAVTGAAVAYRVGRSPHGHNKKIEVP